jgi:hypothetical protein
MGYAEEVVEERRIRVAEKQAEALMHIARGLRGIHTTATLIALAAIAATVKWLAM